MCAYASLTVEEQNGIAPGRDHRVPGRQRLSSDVDARATARACDEPDPLVSHVASHPPKALHACMTSRGLFVQRRSSTGAVVGIRKAKPGWRVCAQRDVARATASAPA